MGRAGYNVPKRRRKTAKMGPSHRVTKEETMKWFQTKYDGILLPGKTSGKK
jgi:large subunit ribosomal protein L11e